MSILQLAPEPVVLPPVEVGVRVSQGGLFRAGELAGDQVGDVRQPGLFG